MRESEENEDSVDKLDSANRDSVSPGISAATSGSAAFSSSSSASSLAAKKAAMSSQAQSRMAILSSACKKHEFVPFTKDGHTVFVKFAIDMEETRWTTGSVASFVIRLLTEGYWTLFVFGKKLQKTHRVYKRFSCENNLAQSSKNYKLDIGKVDELFAYLNSCSFCVGHPDVFPLLREANNGDGLTLLTLPNNEGEAVEVLRSVKWKGKVYPSTVVHKTCELLRNPEEMTTLHPPAGPDDDWFRCLPCKEMATSIKLLNSNAVMNGFSLASSGKMLTSRGSQTEQDDVEMETDATPISVIPAAAMPRLPPPPRAPAITAREPPTNPKPVHLTANTSIVTNGNHPNVGINMNKTSNVILTTPTLPTIPTRTFPPPDPNGPTFLLARNEEGKRYILRDSAGDFYCGICTPQPFRFPQQHEKVSFNEHLWMKHHIFIDSISIWCQACKKPFFDNGRFQHHIRRDHPELA